jgi:hypothetical protein
MRCAKNQLIARRVDTAKHSLPGHIRELIPPTPIGLIIPFLGFRESRNRIGDLCVCPCRCSQLKVRPDPIQKCVVGSIVTPSSRIPIDQCSVTDR